MIDFQKNDLNEHKTSLYLRKKKLDKFLNKTDDHSQNHGNGIENKYALHFIIAFNGTK